MCRSLLATEIIDRWRCTHVTNSELDLEQDFPLSTIANIGPEDICLMPRAPLSKPPYLNYLQDYSYTRVVSAN